MILRIEGLHSACSKIITAVDAGGSLQLKAIGKTLALSVTNGEQFVNIKLDLDEEVNFHAMVDATLFLKLIAQTTTDTVELTLENTCLVLQANGTYKLPLICDKDGNVLEMPVIQIENITSEFDTTGETLNSILSYNSGELTNGAFYEIQQYYYLDCMGCITFSSGACINNFTFDTTAKMLLNNKTVKLFKLFKNEPVHVSYGHGMTINDIIQTKVKFETDHVTIITAIPVEEKLLSTVPATILRERANFVYKYSATLDKNDLLQSLKRLLLLDNYKQQKAVVKTKTHVFIEFSDNGLVIYDRGKINYEKIYYQNDIPGCTYNTEILLDDLKGILERCKEDYIILNFGGDTYCEQKNWDKKTTGMTIMHGNIVNILQEQTTIF